MLHTGEGGLKWNNFPHFNQVVHIEQLVDSAKSELVSHPGECNLLISQLIRPS